MSNVKVLSIFIFIEGKTPIQQKQHHHHHQQQNPLYQTDRQKNIGHLTTKEDLSVSS